MNSEDSHDDSISSRPSSSPSPPPREHCQGRFALNDHEELILHILQRLGSKSYSVLKKLTKQPEIANEEWEVDKLLDIVVDDGEWYLLKWKDWPASFASWERPNVHKLGPRLLAEYEKTKANSTPETNSASDSEADGSGNTNHSATTGAASKKRTITVEELSDMSRSIAKHVSWPAFLKMMHRLDKEMNLGIFRKEEDILRKDLYFQHLSVPHGLNQISPTIAKGMFARKRLEWKLSQLENVYLQVVNDEDDEPIPQLPPGFEYIVTNRYTAPDISPDILESLVGCSCRSCIPGTRKCCSQQAGVSFAYRDDVPNTLLDFQRSQAIYECTSRCKCTPETCSNRVLQKGLTTPMQLFKTKGRGWGLKTLKPIKRGEFVIEYVGEVITSAQADEREGNQYLFDLDFNSEGDGQYTIDAMTLGNLSRFINSRCGDANLSSLAVYVDCQHPDLPRIGFFANRDIEPLEELTFDYMMQGGSAGFESCLCGSKLCRGTINLVNPSMDTNNTIQTNEPEVNTAPRIKKTARQRRRGGKKQQQQQHCQPEASSSDQPQMGELSSPAQHNHLEFDTSDAIISEPLNPNAKDVVIGHQEKNVTVIDLVCSPSSNGDLVPSFIHDDDVDYSDDDGDGEVWHHARESSQPHDVISLTSSDSPMKSPTVAPTQQQQQPQSPTASSLLSEHRQNACSEPGVASSCPAASGETGKSSNTANIDLVSEPDSISSGEKEDHQSFLEPMDVVQPTAASISGEQASC